jgi:subtilisin-like proprotein convertase family protein
MKKVFCMISMVLSSALYADVFVVENNDTQTINDKECFDKTFDMPTSTTLTKVMIDINITHTYRGDLDITLKSPQDTTIELTTDNGGNAENLYVHFNDTASVSITDDSDDHTNGLENRKPEEALEAFNGEDPKGTWTLSVCDDANRDTGEFHFATLYLDDTVPPPVVEGLQVEFRMDECYWMGGANGVDDDVIDSSPSALNGQSRHNADNTATNSVVCRAGDLNNTYDDAELSDAVFYPNETAEELNIGKPAPFTVAAWLYRHDDDKWMAGVIKVSDESWEDGWGLIHTKNSGENIDFFVDDYGTYARTSLPSDTWTHIVATYDGETITLYKNGEKVDTQSQDSYEIGSHAVMVGDDVSGSDIDDRWQGGIDEVKIWGHILSDDEISDIYTNEKNGLNFDGTTRECKQCNGSSIDENSWALIGIPVELRNETVTVEDVFADDMNGSYEDDWLLYKRTYSDTDNGSDYELLELNSSLEFGVGYWLGSRYSNEWFVDGLDEVTYDSSNSDCVRDPCVEIDLTSVIHDFEEDGDDGTGPYRYNMSGFIGLEKPVNWADCRFIVDGEAFTPSDANESGYANKQIWFYNGTGSDTSNSYTTCDDTMDCKLVPFQGFWVELHGKTKGKTVKLLIPKE